MLRQRAVEQWRHDVDQVIIAAINTPPCGGRRMNRSSREPMPSAAHSRSPMAPHVLSAPHAPVASLSTLDLRAEHERRCSGENNRITIERCRERRCNLDGDFGAADTTPVRQAARTPTSPGSGGGCMALSPHLHMVVWPRKFQPHLSKKYRRARTNASHLLHPACSPQIAMTSP
jgi:hypothetical protein